jgi:hypothetical protein
MGHAVGLPKTPQDILKENLEHDADIVTWSLFRSDCIGTGF